VRPNMIGLAVNSPTKNKKIKLKKIILEDLFIHLITLIILICVCVETSKTIIRKITLEKYSSM